MNGSQKLGGAAALIAAATYIVAIALLFTLLSPFATDDLDPGQFMAFLAANQTVVFLWHVMAYMINGVALVVLVLALHARLKAGSPALVQTATVFGLIWAVFVFAGGLLANQAMNVVVDLYGTDPVQAATVMTTLDAVQAGIDNSDRLAGALWVLLVSLAALRSGGLPRLLNYTGVVIGVMGLASTVVPGLEDASIVLGLGLIVWWLWLGMVMLRTSPVRQPGDDPQAVPMQGKGQPVSVPQP